MLCPRKDEALSFKVWSCFMAGWRRGRDIPRHSQGKSVMSQVRRRFIKRYNDKAQRRRP